MFTTDSLPETTVAIVVGEPVAGATVDDADTAPFTSVVDGILGVIFRSTWARVLLDRLENVFTINADRARNASRANNPNTPAGPTLAQSALLRGMATVSAPAPGDGAAAAAVRGEEAAG